MMRTVRAAQAICATCPGRTGCAKLALDLAPSHGVWAGVWMDSTIANGEKRRRLSVIAGHIEDRPKSKRATEDRKRRREAIPTHCITDGCGVRLISSSITPTPPGYYRHCGGGLCNICYLRAYRRKKKAAK